MPARNEFNFAVTSDATFEAVTEGAPVYKSAGTSSFDNSLQPLLAGFRANVPGAWTDNRLLQSQHFTGVAFTAIRALCEGTASATLEITDRGLLDDERAEFTAKAFEKLGSRIMSRRGFKIKGGPGIHAEVGKPDGEPVEFDHPLYELLENPNPIDTFSDYVYEKTLQLALTGSCLEWMVPNGINTVAEMYVVPTALAWPVPYSNQYPRGAWRVTPLYAYGPYAVLPTSAGMNGAIIPTEQIIRTKLKHPLIRWDGYSSLTALGVQMDILEAIDQARWNAFLDGVHPSTIFEVDATKAGAANVTQANLDRFDQQLKQKFAGSRNFGRYMVPPPGVTARPFSTSPIDMDFNAGWEQMRDFVLSGFGVPKGAIGAEAAGSYAQLYAGLKQYFLTTLTPWVRRIADGWNKHLCKIWSDSLRIHLHLPTLDDPTLFEQQLAQDDQIGIRTIDERRAIRGLSPWGGEIGKQVVGVIRTTRRLSDVDPAHGAWDEEDLPESGHGEGTAPPLPKEGGSTLPGKKSAAGGREKAGAMHHTNGILERDTLAEILKARSEITLDNRLANAEASALQAKVSGMETELVAVRKSLADLAARPQPQPVSVNFGEGAIKSSVAFSEGAFKGSDVNVPEAKIQPIVVLPTPIQVLPAPVEVRTVVQNAGDVNVAAPIVNPTPIQVVNENNVVVEKVGGLVEFIKGSDGKNAGAIITPVKEG